MCRTSDVEKNVVGDDQTNPHESLQKRFVELISNVPVPKVLIADPFVQFAQAPLVQIVDETTNTLDTTGAVRTESGRWNQVPQAQGREEHDNKTGTTGEQR